jgi:cyclase
MRTRAWLPPAVGLLAALAAALAAPAAAQQRDFSKVEVKATKVAGNVYMLTGAGGNIGVSVGKDGILIVDDQFAPLAEKIRAALKGLGDGKLRFVLNTHWHGDHTGGNEVFGPEAPILAQTNVRKRLSTEQHVFGDTIPPSPPQALPVITFDESLSVHFNGEEIRAVHYPHGHTDGDAVIFFTGSNVVHLGDDFFSGSFPFVDLASGGSVQGLAENLAKIVPTLPAGVKLIPGHGPLSTVDDLKTFQAMLKESLDLVRRQIGEGKTKEQVQAAGMPEKWAPWGKGFINTEMWLGIVYDSLKGGGQAAPAARHH